MENRLEVKDHEFSVKHYTKSETKTVFTFFQAVQGKVIRYLVCSKGVVYSGQPHIA